MSVGINQTKNGWPTPFNHSVAINNMSIEQSVEMWGIVLRCRSCFLSVLSLSGLKRKLCGVPIEQSISRYLTCIVIWWREYFAEMGQTGYLSISIFLYILIH